MIRRLDLLGLWIALAGVSACGMTERKTDSSAGPSTVEREYAKPMSDVWAAAMDTLKAYELSISEDRRDALGGEILARRADDTQVRISLRSIDEERTRTFVRVEPGDRYLANLIQDRIGRKLGFGL
ncbi:MAG: DUF3568 family protein [Planctomycetes bacterium]|nr:DUF3568 family protein [Planctomycetota bacterium]